MYIEKVEICNFKAIEYMTIEFQQGTNLLIGDNGAGKTSILEALTVALNGILTGVRRIYYRNWKFDLTAANLGNVSAYVGRHYFSKPFHEQVTRCSLTEYSWMY